MRKISLLMHTSLDGFVQGAEPWDLGWINYDAELEDFAEEATDAAGAVIFGRVTFGGMDAHWRSVPDNPESTPHELKHARWLNGAEKIVLSHQSGASNWAGTRFVSGEQEIAQLKNQNGPDILVMGSPSTAQSLMQRDLIDEYRLSVSPVILGSGRRLFKEGQAKLPLKLLSAQTFKSGALGLVYSRVRD